MSEFDDLMDLVGDPEPEQQQPAQPQTEQPAPGLPLVSQPTSEGPLLSRMGVDVSRMLVFDFETGPDTERIDRFRIPGVHFTAAEDCPLPEDFLKDNPTVKAVTSALKELCPSIEWLGDLTDAENARDPGRKGVLAAINEQAELVDKSLKTLCTTPRYAKITAFGWAIANQEPDGRVVSHVEQPAMDCSEAEALELFWQLVEQCHPLIGFNIKLFDIPLALTRSAILGVKPSRRIKLNKYNNSDVVDVFSDMGLQKGQCKEIAIDLGIEVPAGQMEGSRAWQAYCINPESVRQYVKSDVQVERSLYWWGSGYFWD